VWRRTAGLWGSGFTAGEPGVDCPLRFPGQYHDAETGLHYNLTRYYDTDLAAYLSPDPFGLRPAVNPHRYVDNPLMWIDPLGLSAIRVGFTRFWTPQGIYQRDDLAPDHVPPADEYGRDFLTRVPPGLAAVGADAPTAGHDLLENAAHWKERATGFGGCPQRT